MKLTNIETLRERIEYHKNYMPTPYGYVPIGYGGRGNNDLHSHYNIPEKDLSCYLGAPNTIAIGSAFENNKMGNEPTAMYFVTKAFYDEHIKYDKPLTMIEQIEKAQGLIGKQMFGRKYGKVFTVDSMRLFNNKHGVPTWLVPADTEYLKKHGFLVIVENASDYANVDIQEVINNVVKLNDDYDAIIVGNIVKVGCQSIHIDKVKEILNIHNKLKP
jgi:hypothetical protein